MKKLRAKLLLVCASTFLSLLLLEGIFRVIEPKSPPGTTFGRTVRRNADGFRDRDYAIPKPVGAYRTLTLGDSFTWGIGLDVEEIVPKRLEKALQTEFSSPSIEIINASIPGYNTVRELTLFKEKGLKYQPNAVLLMYNLNDIEYRPEFHPQNQTVGRGGPAEPSATSSSPDEEARREVERNIALYAKDRGIRGIVHRMERYSAMVRFAVPRAGMILRKIGLIKSEEFSWVSKLFKGFHDANPGWVASKTALQELAALCQTNNIELFVAIYPLLVELDNYKGDAAHKAIKDWCAQLAVPTIDLLPVFKNTDGRSFWVNYADSHPNADAHQKIANYLLPHLRELIAKERKRFTKGNNDNQDER